MAINVGAGFNPSTNEPIDSRLVASTEEERLAIPSFNCYKGLIVFQQSTNEIYACIDPGNDNISPTWQLLNTGNTIEGDLVVSNNIFANIISSSNVTLTGDGINNIFIINSGSNVPLVVNQEGLIVFDEYLYTPTAVEGGFLYSGSEFFIGLVDC
tara:strand:+ start:263 stop:727 length:465 start_codon:yes stop_codon:yes gene_type:complete